MQGILEVEGHGDEGKHTHGPTLDQASNALPGVDSVETAPFRRASRAGRKAEKLLVHNGFSHIFSDLDQQLIDELYNAFYGARKLEIDTFCVCGHSLGASQVYLFLMMVLDGSQEMKTSDGKVFKLPERLKLKAYTFGSPRIGTEARQKFYGDLLAKYRKRNGDDAIEEFCVRGYNDGESRSSNLTLSGTDLRMLRR